MYLAGRVRDLPPSPTLAIDTKAKQLASEGVDVVNFGIGEPDFDTPRHIKDACIEAINKGFTRYTPVVGIPDLRRAVADRLLRENGLSYTPEQIIICVGGKGTLYNAFMAVCDEGDEVILQAPYWVSYPEIIKLTGGKPVVVETTEKDGFRMTPEAIKAALTPRTRIINLNSPSNPTGALYRRKDLEAIAEIAVRHNLYVISDEIYDRLVYDGEEHVSIASLGPEIKKLTIVCNGASKTYAMTGWRLGYAAAEVPIIKAMGALQGHQTTQATSFVQKATIAALNGPQDCVAEMAAEFDKRRGYVTERCNRIPGWSTHKPQGAFYVFPNVAKLFGKTIRGRLITNADALAEVILDEARVALVAGSGFGAPNNVRLSYATSMERIQTGLDRIEALMKEAR